MTSLYDVYQAQRDLTAPMRAAAGIAMEMIDALPPDLSRQPLLRYLSAGYELTTRARLSHVRPPFGIETVNTNGTKFAVHEEVVLSTPFASLVHFVKDGGSGADRAGSPVTAGPPVLVVAALAGHFSTLLRDTVQTLLSDHDVYITDWHNARDVPLAAGRFGIDEYIDHLIDFLGRIGPRSHVVAVCQPCPLALAAVSIMSADADRSTPRSLTLIAGPVDTRESPTEVNELAMAHPLSWFEENLISTVPLRYPGGLRRVYPGFLQATAFVSMNVSRHVRQHILLFNDLVNGEHAEAREIADFYGEYFSVLDLPAEFYLETIDAVFQRQLLATGCLDWRGTRVDPGAIRRTALLTIEGERDDICGVGQTLAAHALCTGIKPDRKQHILQAGVGHYGSFSGRTWRRSIYPSVRNFIAKNA